MNDTWDGADGPVRPAPQGARANAVPPPAAWTPLLEVDSRVAEPLLDALEDAGVAAYAEPRANAAHADRIHVDATRRDVAEGIVAAELPGLLAELSPRHEDVDPFDAIVAAWDSVPETATWPEAEDVPPARRAEHPVAEPAPLPVRRRDPAEDHYVPPPAPPVKLPTEPATRLAIIALVAGIVLLVVLPLVGKPQSQPVQVLGAIAVLAGIGTLIYRMRDAPSVDDGPDDGAVL